MEWLNYHHLLYFWTVVREGGVVRAAEKLRLSQPTVSAQVKALEARLGEKLFTRVGRRLVPTDVGQVVYRYADEIFSLGRELLDTVQGRATGRPMRLVVGVADVLSKQIAYRLLAPALELPVPVRDDLPRGPGGIAARRPRPARDRPGARRHAGAAHRPREGLQPPARRERRHLLCRAGPGGAAAPPASRTR